MSGQQEEIKRCRKCGENKRLSGFSRSKEAKDGHINSCKDCMRIWAIDYRAKNLEKHKAVSLNWYYQNKEKARQQNKKWSQENKEKRREHARKSNEKHKEKCKERGRVYREENRDKVREGNKIAGKKWRAKNKEAFAAMTKAWRGAHPERFRELVKDWDKRNPEKRKAFGKNSHAKRRTQKDVGKVSAEEWRKIKEAAKGRCHYCKKKTKLTQDHVIPLSKGGLHHPSNIVPACQPCNSSKNAKIITLL